MRAPIPRTTKAALLHIAVPRPKRLASLIGLVVFLIASVAFGPHIPQCPGVIVVARPGPIEAGVAAIRLTPNWAGNTYTVRLLSEAGDAIALTSETLEAIDARYNADAFLRATQRLEPGNYMLEYADSNCVPGGQQLPVVIQAAPAPPDRLGELIPEYEMYCPGATTPETYSGVTLLKTYPPYLTLNLTLDSALEDYRPFMRYRLHDDLGTEWSWEYSQGTFGSFWMPIACVPSASSMAPGHRTLTMLGEIADGSAMQTQIEFDLTCADCPVATPTTTPTAPASTSSPPAGFGDSGGCSVASSKRGSLGAVLALLLLLAVRGWRKGSDGGREIRVFSAHVPHARPRSSIRSKR